MESTVQSTSGGGMWKGLIVGIGVGAAAALLLAPKSGRELREDIRNRYSDLHERTKQTIEEVGSKTQSLARQVGKHAADIADMTRSAARATKEEVQSWKEEDRGVN